jgi:hypothetical protein
MFNGELVAIAAIAAVTAADAMKLLEHKCTREFDCL